MNCMSRIASGSSSSHYASLLVVAERLTTALSECTAPYNFLGASVHAVVKYHVRFALDSYLVEASTVACISPP